jgi:hypothetical protein
MDFSDDQLVALQHAAGLLGRTVDELIQLRLPLATSPSPFPPARHLHHHGRHISDSSSDYTAASPDFGSLAPSHTHTPSHFGYPWPPPAQPAMNQPAASLGTEVILLNPQTAWYDCNADYMDVMDDFSESFSSVGPDDSSSGNDRDSFVKVSEMAVDSDADSESTAREEDTDNMGDLETEWSIIGSPLETARPAGSGRASASRRLPYQSIAPRPGSLVYGGFGTGASKVRKKRSKYQGADKKDTNLTRQLNACVRCRMQRNRVRDMSSLRRHPVLVF